MSVKRCFYIKGGTYAENVSTAGCSTIYLDLKGGDNWGHEKTAQQGDFWFVLKIHIGFWWETSTQGTAYEPKGEMSG